MTARLIRQILVDYACYLRQARPGYQLSLEEGIALAYEHSVDLEALDSALSRLPEIDPRAEPNCRAVAFRRTFD